MFPARPLPGLPAYGPLAQSFPRPDAFSEGFVVEFGEAGGEVWIGNFAKYSDDRQSSIHTELGPHAIVVVAGGAGYLIDADQRRLVREIGFDIQHTSFEDDLKAMVISNGLWFEAFDAHKILWRSRRFSWDGVRNLQRLGGGLAGEAYDPMTDQWRPFCLNLLSGEVQGGSYNGP